MNFYSQKYWKDISEQIIIQEKVCFICGDNENLIVHHKKFKIDGGTEERENLVVLCNLCHTKLHTLERFYRNNHVRKSFDRLALELRRRRNAIA